MPENECYDICQNAWNTYIHKSLQSLITTGKGQPNGKDQPQTEDEKALSSNDFTTTFFVDQTPAQVFNAIKNVGAWWQGEITGNAENIHDEFDYRMKEHHFSRQKVVEQVPGERVVWLVTDSHLNSFQNKREWTGTKLIFDITEINNKTQVRFTHQGLVPAIACFGSCSGAWEKTHSGKSVWAYNNRKGNSSVWIKKCSPKLKASANSYCGGFLIKK